jgi:hypothetical protein
LKVSNIRLEKRPRKIVFVFVEKKVVVGVLYSPWNRSGAWRAMFYAF